MTMIRPMAPKQIAAASTDSSFRSRYVFQSSFIRPPLLSLRFDPRVSADLFRRQSKSLHVHHSLRLAHLVAAPAIGHLLYALLPVFQ